MKLPFFPRRISPIVRPFPAKWAAQSARIHKVFFASPWSEGEIEELLRRPDTVADAATDGSGELMLGFAISRVIAPDAELLSIAVDKARQRAGVAKVLLGAHMGRISAAGAKDLFLEVDESNAPALALYRSFGFRQVGTRKGYYPKKDGTRATALVMKAELR